MQRGISSLSRGKKDAVKELAHTVGAGKFEIRMAGQQATNSRAGVKAAG